MPTLRKSLQEYLAMRRGLGWKLHGHGRPLEEFVKFMEERAAARITNSLALKWAKSPSSKPSTWADRLRMVRGFARYLSAFDPRTEVSPTNLLPKRRSRPRAYLYTEKEIQQILAGALKLRPTSGLSRPGSGLRRWTYYTLLGLISVTGLRRSEALNLELKDVDLKQCVLTIRGSKFGRSRYVPIHSSTAAVVCRRGMLCTRDGVAADEVRSP